MSQVELKERKEGALQEVALLSMELEELRGTGYEERAKEAEIEVRQFFYGHRRTWSEHFYVL
jgi:hypothetical protein